MKIHPNQHTLGKLVDRVAETGGRRVLRHVVACERCRRRLGELLTWDDPRRGRTIPWTPKDYGAMLDRLVESAAAAGFPLTREQVEAPVLLAELILQPPRRRRLLLRNSKRYQSWSLADLILDRSREEAFEDPAQAESLARLGLEVVDRLEGGDHEPALIADLRARGLCYLGNALRMRSDLRGAEESFAAAREELERGSGDPVDQARLLALKASLRKDQQRFDEAVKLLDQAIANYRSVGETRRAARALLTRAVVVRHSGSPEAAIRQLRDALPVITTSDDPRLALCAQHDLAFWLTDLDRFMEASKAFRDAEPLYERFTDPWTQRRRAWVEGRILRGLGQLEAAERRLVSAQRGFVEQEIAYDAALVSLDLAAVYAEQGRNESLRILAAEMVPIFRSRDIHREALAALSLFREAVESEAASASLVHHLLTYLRRARHDPSLRFEWPRGDA